MTAPPVDKGTAILPGSATPQGQVAAGSPERFPGSFGAKSPPATAAPLAAPAGGSPPVPADSPAPPANVVAPHAPTPAPPAATLHEPDSLNLARRPFVNTRPVQRVAAILWVLGALLLAANVALFRGYLGKSQTTRFKLAGIERDIARERRAGAELQGTLGNLNLGQQNREVIFLNRKIDERTFSWSLLFERMAEVLPKEVRLLRLRPNNVVQREIGMGPKPSANELNPPPVTLTMHCEAKNDGAMLRFVDNLFAHPAFAEPNLQNEERLDSGLVRFDLVAQYQPNSQVARSPAAPAHRPALAPAAGRPRQVLSPPAARPLSPAGAGLVRVAPPPRTAPRRPSATGGGR